MSILSYATFAAFKAAFTTASGEPTNVKTVLFVELPGSTSNNDAPGVPLTAELIASIT